MYCDYVTKHLLALINANASNLSNTMKWIGPLIREEGVRLRAWGSTVRLQGRLVPSHPRSKARRGEVHAERREQTGVDVRLENDRSVGVSAGDTL